MTGTAIILAGGFGTRLQSVVSDLPKPMAPVNGEPFLNYQLRYLKHYGIEKVILSVGHLHQKIQDYYKHNFEGININYSIELNPMGTGGGIRLAMEQCTEELPVVLNGDSFFDMDLYAFFKFHKEKQSDVSLALRDVNDASRYGTVITDHEHSIISFSEKSNEKRHGKINAGIYLLDKRIFLSNTAANTAFSIEKDFFEKQLNSLAIKGFEFEGYFIDIGIPEDYNKAQNDFKGFKYR